MILCWVEQFPVSAPYMNFEGLRSAECVPLTDDALADRIRRDGIDIPVDLSGHTEGHRLPMFARQSAPVKVSLLGLPLSTRLRAMHYWDTDAVMDPSGVDDGFHSEKLVRLNRFYAAFRPNPQAHPVGAGPPHAGRASHLHR